MGTQQTGVSFDHGVRAFRHDRPSVGSAGEERHDAIVVGGGQAGLATAYHLTRRGLDVVVLDEQAHVGDGWREAWDSLRLFTPARYDGLPGMPFPGDPSAFPSRDEMAAYLSAYAARFALPVLSGLRVDALRRVGERDPDYVVTAGERRFRAPCVVVATGPHRAPSVPSFATALSPSIRQLHSSAYRNPEQLQPGPALVVGASHSGPDVALELAASHRTILSGPFRGEIPFDVEGRPARAIVPVLWLAANRLLTVGTPVGRKIRPEVRSHGGPLIRVKARHLAAAGVEHVPARTVGVRDGLPVLDGGRVLEVANVVWCTGFRLDFDWIDLPVVGEDGWPLEDRGVVTSAPGLYFVGLPFQRSFASMLIGGAGSDAAYVARQVAGRLAAAAAA